MRRLFALLLPLAVLACAANPVKTATEATPENRTETVAFALHNSYVVVAERAVSIAEQPTTPREVKQVLLGLHEVASPAAKKLQIVALEVERVRAAVAAGTTPTEKLTAALDALGAAITDAAPKINALAREVGGTP